MGLPIRVVSGCEAAVLPRRSAALVRRQTWLAGTLERKSTSFVGLDSCARSRAKLQGGLTRSAPGEGSRTPWLLKAVQRGDGA